MLDAADAGADRTGARAEAVPLEVSYHRISVRREEVIMSLVELCRLCRGQSDRIPIFEHGGYIPYKISFCLNIEVKESDERRTLCQLCYTKLNEFNEFKNMCRNTQEQGIGTGLAIKIKEEPKDEPPELDDLFTSIKVDPDLPPVRMIKLPFLFKEEEKKVQDSLGESDVSLDSLINQVQTDESEDGVPADPPEEQSSPPIADPPVEEQTSKTTKRKNEMTTPRRCKRQKVEAPKSARLTRSSTGVLQRKPIIDEEEEEEDVDDPDDDVADPDFNKDTDEVIEPELPEGTCEKCKKQFSSPLALDTHQMEVHSDESWYCYKCLCGFPNLKTWKYHRHNFCKKCPDTSECSPAKDEPRQPADDKPRKPAKGEPTHPSSGPFKCSFCNIEMDTNSEFLEHLKIHKKNSVPLLKCNHCDKTFKEKGALICHKEFQHKSKQSTSSVNKSPSNEKSASEVQIVKNYQMGKSNREYKCNKCEQIFSNSGNLICHQVLAHPKK